MTANQSSKAGLTASLMLWACLGQAQEGPASALSLELNTAETVGASCRLTFVARNALDTDIEQLVLETVLFTTDGQVGDITLFDFGALPAGKARVRRFDMANLDCGGLGSVLVNGVDTCSWASGDGCGRPLTVSSRTDIGLDG